MKLIFFGKPGTGKGTVAAMLEERNRYFLVEPGELLRKEERKNTKEAKVIKYKKMFNLAEIFAGSIDNLFGNRTIKIGINATAADNDFPRFMYLWTGYQQNYLFKWPAFN